MEGKQSGGNSGNDALFLIARLMGQTPIADVDLDIPEELADIEEQE